MEGEVRQRREEEEEQKEALSSILLPSTKETTFAPFMKEAEEEFLHSCKTHIKVEFFFSFPSCLLHAEKCPFGGGEIPFSFFGNWQTAFF